MLKVSQEANSEILKVQSKLGKKRTYRRWIELKIKDHKEATLHPPYSAAYFQKC